MAAALLLVVAAGPPLVLAAALAWPAARPWCERLAPAAALPALALALLAPAVPATPIDALLVGVEFGLGQPRRALLGACALIWLAAGLRQWMAGWPNLFFLLSFLGTQAGSLGALIAADAVGYYLFYSLLTIASYGLVAVDRSHKRLWAGRLYLGASITGEMAAITAFMLMAGGFGGGALLFLLILFGLGAKMGVPPLHATLAPAHAAAPPAGAAVLGGVLTTTAAAGWLQFLPQALPIPDALAHAVIALGFTAAFGGVVLGAVQTEPKAVLAYSTVSQMGLATLGAGMAAAAQWPGAAAALGFFILHHALTKASLLLALPPQSKAASPAALAAAVLLSLSLSGAPLSSGALAKLWLEMLGNAMPAGAWRAAIHQLLPLTSAATALLMARFVWLIRHPDPETDAGPAWPGLVLAAAALAAPVAFLPALGGDLAALSPLEHLWDTAWPVALGLGLAVGMLWLPARLRPRVPVGDLAAALSAPARWLLERLTRPPAPRPQPEWDRLARHLGERLRRIEHGARAFQAAGLAWFALLSLLLALAWPW